MPPTGGAIDMSLSFSTTTSCLVASAAVVHRLIGMPALIEPSPITATTRWSSPSPSRTLASRAAQKPSAAEIEVAAWRRRRGRIRSPPAW